MFLITLLMMWFDVLGACNQNNITVQPEHLRKRLPFLSIENQFKSPIPAQSIVSGLEGFPSMTSIIAES